MKRRVKSFSTPTDILGLQEIVKAEVWRGDKGYYTEQPDENICVNDLITNAGRIFLAKRIAADSDVASAIRYMAVGTVTTVATLTDTGLTGEVARKPLAVYSAQTNNVFTAVATFGGAADSVTSLALTEALLTNHASSGNGTAFQRVTFAAVTLASSDLVKITLQTNVGSNTI